MHPAADVFPMMSDAELEELSKDIKEGGLLKAVILWRDPNDDHAEKLLLDGRNRLEAMERAIGAIPPCLRRKREVAS